MLIRGRLRMTDLDSLLENIKASGKSTMIYWYPFGDESAREEVTRLSYKTCRRDDLNMLVLPRPTAELACYGIEMIECNPCGLEILSNILLECFRLGWTGRPMPVVNMA